jgi:hypothetical protein
MMDSPMRCRSGLILMRTANMINQKFLELEKAAQEFKAALIKFQSVYDPETVGIVETCEHIDEILFDIDQELQEQE